jgi:hypothetical protein
LLRRYCGHYQPIVILYVYFVKHIGSLKAYVLDFNAQMNATPKMDEFSKKSILLDGLQKWVVDALFKFPELLEDVVGINKIG